MTSMVRAGGLRGFDELVARLGHDPAALLARFALASDALRDEDALLPVRLVIQLLETAAAALDCPDFGLRLAASQDASTLGPLALALRSASTVAESVAFAARYLFTHSPANALRIVEPEGGDPDEAELRYDILLPRLPPARQSWDLGLGLAHRMFKLSVGDAYRPRLVRLPHAPLAAPAVYTRYFGAPVAFEQPAAGILLDRALLAWPNRRADPMLKQVASSYLESRFSLLEQGVAPRTRAAIARALERSGAPIARIAEDLGMHPRTLQRHLKADGTCFEILRDEVRRDAALRYIASTRMPMAQVSGLLGLSEQSALTRSCRRWFGQTPLALRRTASPGVARPQPAA